MKNKNIILSLIIAVIGLVLILIGVFLHFYVHTDDLVKGYLWKANDGSMLYLYNDNTFVWYKEDNVFDNNYYYGTYELYKGDSAITYVDKSLSDYGITKEEQEQIIGNMKDKIEKPIDYYYALILNNEFKIVDGVSTNSSNKTPLIGFFYEEKEYLDLANLNTANYSGFTRIRKINGKENKPTVINKNNDNVSSSNSDSNNKGEQNVTVGNLTLSIPNNFTARGGNSQEYKSYSYNKGNAYCVVRLSMLESGYIKDIDEYIDNYSVVDKDIITNNKKTQNINGITGRVISYTEDDAKYYYHTLMSENTFYDFEFSIYGDNNNECFNAYNKMLKTIKIN